MNSSRYFCEKYKIATFFWNRLVCEWYYWACCNHWKNNKTKKITLKLNRLCQIDGLWYWYKTDLKVECDMMKFDLLSRIALISIVTKLKRKPKCIRNTHTHTIKMVFAYIPMYNSCTMYMPFLFLSPSFSHHSFCFSFFDYNSLIFNQFRYFTRHSIHLTWWKFHDIGITLSLSFSSFPYVIYMNIPFWLCIINF